LISLIALLYDQISQWFGQSITLSTWLEYLPNTLGWWCGHLLTVAVFTFCFTHAYLERHTLRDYRQQHLLIAYGVVSLVIYLAMWFVSVKVFFWIYDTFDMFADGQVLGPLLVFLFGMVRFGLEVVLPLWLCLHLFRSQAQDVASVNFFTASTVALCFALVMAVFNIHLTNLAVQLIGSFTYMYESNGWENLLILANSMVVAFVVFAAARQELPAQVQRFRARRLLLACVITLLLWLVTATIGALLVLVLLFMFGTIRGAPVVLVLLSFALLALLWPLSKLGLGWGYRAQPA
jgi:hypothetical protein